MRVVLIVCLVVITMACSSQNEKTEQIEKHPDRLVMKFKDITEIARLRRITDLKKDMNPFFSVDGKRIYFTRLLVPTPADTENVLSEARERYFSIDYKKDKLYLLEGVPDKPHREVVPIDSLPQMTTEKPLFGYQTSKAIYFCACSRTIGYFTNIYKLINDSLVQITYGHQPALLEAISPDERYLVFLYGENSCRLVILDLSTDEFYVVPKSEIESNRYDFSPGFSPDSRYLVFLRSGELYQKGLNPFGDIWLVEFKDSQ
jgi:hypothetical protein